MSKVVPRSGPEKLPVDAFRALPSRSKLRTHCWLAEATLRRLLATGLCICFLAAHRGKNIGFSDGFLIVVAPPIAEPSIVKVTVAHIIRRTNICSSDVDSVGQAVLFGVALLCALPHGAPWLPS